MTFAKTQYRMAARSALFLAFLFLNCNEMVNEHSPRVNPELIAVGTDFATIRWKSAGDEYYYAVILSSDTINDNDFRGIDTMYENIYDTTFTINGLDSGRYYKVKVGTFGGNKAPNESWPPLRFRTE